MAAVPSIMGRAAGFAHHGALWASVAIGFSIPVSTALDNVLVAALVVLWIASGRFAGKWAALRANSFVLFPFGLFVLAFLGSFYSIGERQEVLHAIDKASVLLLIPVLVSLRPPREFVDRAVNAFTAAMLLTLALSYLIWLGFLPAGGVIKGIPEDPSVFKLHITHSFLMAFAVLLFALKAREASRKGTRYFFALAAALAAVNVLVLVHGRTGQLVLLALAVYLLIAWLRWRGALAALIAGGAFAAVVYVSPSSALHERVTATVAEIADWRAGKPAQMRNMRLESWSNSLEIVREKPLVGVGTGGFAAAYAKHVEGTPMLLVGQPENQYLLTAVQLGAIGLAALLALFGAQWRLAGRLAMRRDITRGLVVAMAVGCFFNSFLRDHAEALFYAWLSGLLYAGLIGPTETLGRSDDSRLTT
jgi:O-antigen ligase